MNRYFSKRIIQIALSRTECSVGWVWFGLVCLSVAMKSGGMSGSGERSPN